MSDKKYNALWADALVQAPHKIAIVAERDKQIVAAAWATIGHYFVTDDGLVTTVHGIVLDHENLNGFSRVKTFTKVVKALQKLSLTRDCNIVMINNATGFGLSTTGRIMRSLKAISSGKITYLISQFKSGT